MEKDFRRLRKFTYRLPGGEILEIGFLQEVTSGWVVALKDATNFEGDEGFFAAIRIAERTTQTIARIFDDEIEMWDVVMIFDDEDEATRVGKEMQQLSIYQIETGRLKWLE